MSATFTAWPASVSGGGIEPTVATMSSDQMKPRHGPTSSVTISPAVPSARMRASTTASDRMRRRNARSSALSDMASVVVGLVLEDLVGAEELLEEHHAGELVGHRQRPEREAVVGALELEAVRAADDEAQVAAAHAAVLEEAAEAHAVERLAGDRQERHEGALGDAALDALVLADLDELEPGMAREQLLVVGDVFGERRLHPAHGHDDDPH